MKGAPIEVDLLARSRHENVTKSLPQCEFRREMR
jgi:hypothetical protein